MSFDSIRGQDRAIEFLRSAIKSKRFAHAYIFAGTDGCGRSLLARNFAKAVNCEDKENVPCDHCSSCRKIDRDTHPDVKWVKRNEKSGEIKIGQIRELGNQIALKPYEGKYKVFIIVEAELMNLEAANSFLKTLEEPPSNSLFVLIAERPKDLLPTVASRCQIVRLKPLGGEELASILVSEHGMSGERAEFLAKLSEGRLGKAISYKDDTLEWKNDILQEFSDEECAEDYTAGNRGELSEKLNILASWYRDLLVFKTTGKEDFLINLDRADDIKKEGSSYNVNELMRILENVLDAKEKIESNVNPKLALTVMFKAFK